MTGTASSAQKLSEVAIECWRAAADIGVHLRVLRAHLAGPDRQRRDLSEPRRADLLAGFDIYSRMLDDALRDIAEDLDCAAKATAHHSSEPTGGREW